MKCASCCYHIREFTFVAKPCLQTVFFQLQILFSTETFAFCSAPIGHTDHIAGRNGSWQLFFCTSDMGTYQGLRFAVYLHLVRVPFLASSGEVG